MVMSELNELFAHDQVLKYTDKNKLLAYSMLIEELKVPQKSYPATSGPLTTAWDSCNFRGPQSLQKLDTV